MDKKAKYDLMQKIGRELEDLKHSQEAVIKKVTQIEAHNIELSDSNLESVLSDIHEHVAESINSLDGATTAFEETTSKYATENSAALAAVE